MRIAAGAGILVVLLGTGLARAASVAVDVQGIEDGSVVLVALCQGSLAESDCRIGQQVVPRASTERIVFPDVAPGTYAAIAYQDANGNGRLDRTGLGLPLEPYGFSGDASRGARPDFARAAFSVRDPGVSVRVRLSRALPGR